MKSIANRCLIAFKLISLKRPSLKKTADHVLIMVGGGGSGFFSDGQNAPNHPQETGKGGKGYLHGGTGGQNYGGFGGGGGFLIDNRGVGGGGGYSGGNGAANEEFSCGGDGGSFNDGTHQQNECCHNSDGHGRVFITLLQRNVLGSSFLNV